MSATSSAELSPGTPGCTLRVCSGCSSRRGSSFAVTAGVALAAGSPAAGKRVYLANGCGACHTFKPAGSKGTIGPALTRSRLSADANRAKQPLTTFIRTSIVKPKAFVARGYQPVMPSYAKLSKKQLHDLVAFIAKG